MQYSTLTLIVRSMTQLYNKSLTHDQHQCHLFHISMMFTIHFKLHVHLSQYNDAHCHDCHDQGLGPCVAKATEGASGEREGLDPMNEGHDILGVMNQYEACHDAQLSFDPI